MGPTGLTVLERWDCTPGLATDSACRDDWLGVPCGAPLGVRLVEMDGREAALAGPLAGCDRFVERFKMSFPCTTRLSLLFLRSLVSISDDG